MPSVFACKINTIFLNKKRYIVKNGMTKVERSAFRHIMKGTAVFGGTQLLTMMANIVKGKFVAMFLSDYGMGISSLMQSALMPMQQLFSFGLPAAGVKDIAAETDPQRKAQMVLTFRRMLYTLAVLGALVMATCASLFSISTFGDDSHTWWFVEMSVALLFFILAAGENTILQGYRRLKSLAACNIMSAVCGLLCSTPLYYFYGIEGIVPAMMILSVTMFCFTRYSTSRISIHPQQQTWRNTLLQGKSLLVLGGVMMVSGFIGTVTTYFINTFIRKYGSIPDVGLFQAANIITLQATAMIFTAMGTDYYPSLSAAVNKREEVSRMVENEGEIVVLIMAPITILLILIAPIIVNILLTPTFNVIIPLLRLIAISFMGRAFCFPLEYVCMAYGDKAFFFWTQGIWSNAQKFILYVCGYYFWGLIGLGYAVVLSAVIDIAISSVLIQWRYKIHYSTTMLHTLLPLIAVNITALAASYIPHVLTSYSIMTICTLITCIFSYRQLDKRIGFKDLISQIKKNG